MSINILVKLLDDNDYVSKWGTDVIDELVSISYINFSKKRSIPYVRELVKRKILTLSEHSLARSIKSLNYDLVMDHVEVFGEDTVYSLLREAPCSVHLSYIISSSFNNLDSISPVKCVELISKLQNKDISDILYDTIILIAAGGRCVGKMIKLFNISEHTTANESNSWKDIIIRDVLPRLIREVCSKDGTAEQDQALCSLLEHIISKPKLLSEIPRKVLITFDELSLWISKIRIKLLINVLFIWIINLYPHMKNEEISSYLMNVYPNKSKLISKLITRLSHRPGRSSGSQSKTETPSFSMEDEDETDT